MAERASGHCVLCNRFVEIGDEGCCPEGHPERMVTGRITLSPDEELPELGRFNVAAFLIPPIWGPWYRQFIGLFFIPLWLFADSAYQAGLERGAPYAYAAYVLFAGNLGLHMWFGLKGNALAWRATGGRHGVAQFKARQRQWAWASIAVWGVAIAALFVVRVRGGL